MTQATTPGPFDALKTQIRGVLLTPSDAGYDVARSVWNAMIDKRPAAILRCLNTPDVVAGVNFARSNGLTLSIKGGGHNIAGLGVCDGGLVVETHELPPPFGRRVRAWMRRAARSSPASCRPWSM